MIILTIPIVRTGQVIKCNLIYELTPYNRPIFPIYYYIILYFIKYTLKKITNSLTNLSQKILEFQELL